MRLLWVVPRYGAHILGGAETLVRALATRGGPSGWSMEVATTCAIDHYTWKNAFEPGESEDEGVLVRRFPVGARDQNRYDELHPRILSQAATYSEQLEWLSNSVWSPELQRFLSDSIADYNLVILSPYLFGTSIWGAQVEPERSVLMPCLHDEPYAYLPLVGSVMRAVRGHFFNSEGERRLAERIYPAVEGDVVGVGFDPPAEMPGHAFARDRGLTSYLLYAGRIEEGKRVHVAVDYTVRYAAERNDPPKLVLIGRGTYAPPASAAEAVVVAGYLSEEEKRAAYAEALALVNPSELESLSLTMMEAWLEGTPTLAAAGSDVLREHCERSGGGLLFGSYEEYRDAVDKLVFDSELRARLGSAGRRYVLETYGWPAVRERFRCAVERLAQ